MTYAGTAIGSSSAHSKSRRPGNRHMTVSHAVDTPPTITPKATPAISRSELAT
jgi:hypothetical protein